MGGVLVKNFDISLPLLEYLGHPGKDLFNLSPAVRKAITEHSTGAISEKEFWKIFQADTGYKVEDESDSLLTKFFKPILDKGTEDIIKELKAEKTRVVCGTNVIDGHYEYLIKHGLYSIFDKVYASHLIGYAKPDPSFLKKIMEEEKCSPSEVFFIDDMPENVIVAEGLGIKSCCFDSARGLREKLKKSGLLL